MEGGRDEWMEGGGGRAEGGLGRKGEVRERRIRRACQHVVIHDQLQCTECVHIHVSQ